jgi:TonB-dependent SusC/RagA subfamily outer membrane receptor
MREPSIFPGIRGGMALALCVVFTACASTGDGGLTSAGEPDEQVRIGYGTQDRADVTSSVGSVTAEGAGREVTRIEDLIEGRIPGVEVHRLSNGRISLRIRGNTSILGSNEPLLVIDGLPIHNDPGYALMSLNPSEIARIDVLKDAGSTAIYGSRGANGVVVITRRGSR